MIVTVSENLCAGGNARPMGLPCSKLSRCEPFAKEIYREKAAVDFERYLVGGNVCESEKCKSRWGPTPQLPADESDVPNQVA